jgi:poly(beta-D-mannuronate) C5 epimerase
MIIFDTGFIVTTTALLLLSVTFISNQQLRFADAGTGGGGACVDYGPGENTITITCNASFLDVVGTVNDQSVLESVGDQEYLLKANLQVNDGTNLSMQSDDIKWLKITGANGIIVNGKIQINGVKITSWDASANDVVQQNINGSIGRAYIQFAASEGAEILNSEFAYLGYIEPGQRGFDLFGDGPSHDMEIRGSKFHHMWMAFYSKEAYNIVVDENEYHHNIKYALDPHTGTHDMNITNNWLHHNLIGAICSDDCYNILVEGNVVHHNTNAGIFFSRNMSDSIARNNHVYNASTGILVSESPDNEIYNNTIHGATSEGVLLLNPEVPDDGFTEGNIVYNNAISDSDDGIRATRSHNNILENITFSDIESSEYLLSGNSSVVIRGQDFDNALITAAQEEEEEEGEEESATSNLVEIVDSGTIEVVEVNDGGEGEDGDGGDDEEEGNQYETDNTPYRKRLSDGDSIRVDS